MKREYQSASLLDGMSVNECKSLIMAKLVPSEVDPNAIVWREDVTATGKPCLLASWWQDDGIDDEI